MHSKQTIEKMVDRYKEMCLIRFFEERVDELVSDGEIGGTIHLCIGQEAVPVGACAALRKSDYVVGTHRGHGHIIAKGADINIVMAELFGRKTGYCKGLGGTQHMAAFDKNFLGTNGITGGGIPVATGAALALKIKKSDSVVICFMGDGAVNQGTFHESLNMASVWKLPVIYVIENNLYAMSTPIDSVVNIDRLSLRSVSYGINGITIDGNDVFAVEEIISDAVRQARLGKGPSLIEAMTYRHKGHSRSDPRMYRTKDEEKLWLSKDPIVTLGKRISEKGIKHKRILEEIRLDIFRRIDAAVSFARQSESLDPEEMLP